MKPFSQKIKLNFFDKSQDFRIRLFYILAFGGIAVSFFTVIISLAMRMWRTAALAALLIVFSLALIVFTQKTRKYKLAYLLTIIVVFMLILPMMFFTSGGHRSGMPSVFLLAVMFTVLMLKGRAAILISVLEIAEYSAVCIAAYYYPAFVSHFETETEILVDIIFAFTCVSLICGIVLYFHLKEYDRQRELLCEQNEKLKRYDASRSVFLTTVSHEIKNPLNAINLHARDTFELMDELPIDSDAVKNNQQTIEKMVLRIDRILDDLKDTVAIEQGRLSLSLAPVLLAKLIREVSETYFGRYNTSGNRLVLDLDETLPPISADHARITQVVINLLSNAVQHTQDGIITISLFQGEEEQVVSVADTGEGMQEKIRREVFKGYVSENEEYWRHGIGLYVSHQIIESHDGTIHIESKLGEGTAVTFALPDRR